VRVRVGTTPTTGSATLSVATTGDSADKADGSVPVTLNADTGYTVSSSQSAATVAVADDDDPPRWVLICCGPSAVSGAGIVWLSGPPSMFATTPRNCRPIIASC